MIRSFPPHPNPLPCLRRSGFAQAGPRGEGRPFIPPAELGGILAYFDKAQFGFFECQTFQNLFSYIFNYFGPTISQFVSATVSIHE